MKGFVPMRPTNFQQHQRRIERLLVEGMHDGRRWKDEAFVRYNDLEAQEAKADSEESAKLEGSGALPQQRLSDSSTAAEPSRGAPAAVGKLRAARTAWHEKNGVPISQEYANFLTAIGEVESGHVVLLEALKGLVNWCRHPLHGGIQDLPKPLEPYLLQAEAAIQQAERGA